jgi:hypothetical protein
VIEVTGKLTLFILELSVEKALAATARVAFGQRRPAAGRTTSDATASRG